MWIISLFLAKLIFKYSSVIYRFLKRSLTPLFLYLTPSLVKIINFLLFALITIPWWFCGEYLKPFFTSLIKYIQISLDNHPAVAQKLINIKLTFDHKKRTLYAFLKKVYILLWKKFIDFLFFTLYRYRDSIFKCIKRYVTIIFTLLLVYLLIFENLLNIAHNYVFASEFQRIICWDTTTYSGLFYIFVTFLNPDNVVKLLHIAFFKIGLYNIVHLDYYEVFLKLGYAWLNACTEYRVENPNFSFIKLFCDDLKSNVEVFYNSGFDISGMTELPLFFFFGFLFFMSVILSWFFFSYLGLQGIYKLNIWTLFFFWLSLLLSAKTILVNQKVFTIKVFNWVFLSLNIKTDFYFFIDTISFSFMLLTTTISLFVFIYAFSYFRYEPLVDRFLLFLLSFVISMIFLVTSGNIVMLFLGWELIGFTSFCLINFWTTKTATLKSAFKAFTFNKVSDFFMFMFLVTAFSIFYTFDIQSINEQVSTHKFHTISLFGTQINSLEFLSIIIIGAAFIKSAQFGGHAWLPDSMEAPVPASSLIHSATLVSAGVYLILRFNFIFDSTEFSKFLIPIVGSLTAAYGGVCASAQSDIKKTLAYSTISHCGFLMVLCSTEMNEFTILYLYVHGFFKAGVFMCVGNVLRVCRGYQDTRRMGGLVKYLPFEYFCIVIGVLNLAGLPFTFGFFIKHLLLQSLGTHMYVYYFVIFHSLVGAFSGLFYSYKLVTNIFNDFKKGNKSLYTNLNKNNYSSKYYTNSSVAGTLSIFCLFVSAYVIIFFMLRCFMSGNFLFSDYINTTVLSNYYATVSSPYGYLLNFSYINITVIAIMISLIFSKFRKTQHIHTIFKFLTMLLLILLFFFLVYVLI